MKLISFRADYHVAETLVLREFVKLKAEKVRMMGLAAQPILLWLVFSFGFDQGFVGLSQNGNSFREFFFPGILLMTLMFGCVFSSMTIIDDRNNGFLQSALVSPARRFAVVCGKTAGVGAVTLIQVFCVAIVSSFFMASSAGWNAWLLVGWMILSAFALVPFNLAIALFLNSTQSYHSFMGVCLFPLWALSGAVFPISNQWLSVLAMLNPLTYMVDGFRYALGPTPHVPLSEAVAFLGLKAIVLFVFGIVGVFFALLSFRGASHRA